jgi:hypothetical protein
MPELPEVETTLRGVSPHLVGSTVREVIVPENVKVTIAPTPQPRWGGDPGPGWRGQITADWLERRLGGSE